MREGLNQMLSALRAIGLTPALQRTVIARFFEGTPHRQFAARERITVWASKKRVYRANCKLRAAGLGPITRFRPQVEGTIFAPLN